MMLVLYYALVLYFQYDEVSDVGGGRCIIVTVLHLCITADIINSGMVNHVRDGGSK